MQGITESGSHHDDLDRKSTRELLEGINAEDFRVPEAVAKVIPAIEPLVDAIVERMKRGGRLFYLGAGTSGRSRANHRGRASQPERLTAAFSSAI